MKISEILMTYKTDKARDHSYGPFYDQLFARFDKEAPLNILELGVQGGGSLLAWKDYFPNANVQGIDISDSRHKEYISDRVTFTKIDLRDFQIDDDMRYDIIIDDSDHFIGTQMFIVERFYPFLNSGGVLVIEDVQSPEVDVADIKKILPMSAVMETTDLRHLKGRHDDFLITLTHA
jgi:trans-aconitate methyltransferase